MVYATSAGGYILGIADLFVNNIVIILSVFFDPIPNPQSPIPNPHSKSNFRLIKKIKS